MTGLYFEEFEDGMVIDHTIRRTVTEMDSRSRPDPGIVDFQHEAFNQEGTLVAVCKRQGFMRKRSAAS